MKSYKAGVATITSLAKKGLYALLLLGSGSVFGQNPSASFTSNVFSGCAPLSVDFTNLSTNATSYFWDFGNGNTSVLTDPTTVYLTPGFYTVTLVAVNNASGLRDTLTAVNYIRVVDDPVPDFTAFPLTGCAGNNTINFTNLSANATSYIWDFGDGTFSTQANPSHSYSSTGVYTVKLIARNAFTCTKVKVRTAYITIVPNPPAAFTVNQQSSCDPATVFQFNATTPGATSWSWNFGDGATSTLQSPSHVYGAQGTYDVTLIVTNASGCTDTLVQPGYINIGASLVPTFTVNSQTGCPPFNAQFTCNVPNATTWSWDFGDGTSASSQNPSHLYTSPGQYTISLTVTTASGCNGSAVYPAHITVDTLPVPSFTPSAASGCAPLQTTFNNTTTAGVSYLWDLGNGTSSTDMNPSVTYTAAGTYPVTLTATSVNGCQVSYTDSFAVTVNDITANINGTPRIGCAPLAVTANGTSTPPAVSWSWNFGDGTTGSGASVPHVYTNIGNYTVTLIATSAAGCTDTVVKPAFFKVVDDTTIYTVPDTMLVCLPPGAVSFTDPTIGSNSWIWYWGNGDSSTVKNPTYTYSAPGIYTVSLVTGMAGGCRQFINPIAIVEVVPFIVSPIVSVITSPCGPYTVQLDNQTLNVASYLWDFGDGTTSTLQNPVHTYVNPGTYTISLLLTSINGCQTTLNTTVTFGHTAPITASENQLCLGSAVNFSLTPASAFVSAVWDFGDGNTSNVLSPSYTYASTGVYNVSVTVTDTNGCVFSYTYPTPIEVTDPQPSFILNQPTVGCAPFTVQFNNTSTGATGYFWNFGDGDTSLAVSPSHTYTVAGTYTVTLIASAPGCVDSVVMTNLITVNAAVANFTFTPSTGCLPLTVTFTDMSTSPVSWFWDFGDGTTSTQQNPVHTYVTDPTGLVSLTIVDANGCTKTKRKPNVTIIRPDITVNDSVGCRPFTVSFSTSLVATSYLWDFGDGTTSSQQNPSHTYTQTGLYTVTLTTVLASGCTTSLVKPGFIQVIAPVADFMSPTVAVCAPSLVNFVNQSTGAASYLWDFGDGTTSTSTDPAHIYNAPGAYTITLIAYSSNGCTDTLIRPDYIVVPGTLTSFTPTDTIACANTLIQFNDQSLNANQWFWDFGDGTTSTQQNPGHVYLTAGTYTVTLITNDSIGCSSFYTFPVPIDITPIPDAVGSVVNTVGCSPFTTSFTNNSTGAVSYQWNFGDGGVSANANPTYTYNTAGVYQVSLIAVSSNGCTDTMQLPSAVTVHQTPVARFLRSVNSGCEPLTVSFTNQSTFLNGSSYLWDFGNGQTSTLQDPVMQFMTAGVYNVTLTVTNTGGCTDTYTRPITVLARPVAGATLSGNGGCSPYQVTFTNTTTGASSYLWDFGNGNTSTSASPVYTYTNAGSYQAMLVATAANGCTDTFIVPAPVVVDQTPVAAFSRNPSSGCVPVTITTANNSSALNNPAYLWDFGNGSTSTGPNPVITYTTAGTYTITLTVTNSGGCTSTATRTVNAYPVPDASASASGNAGCTPYQVSFTNTTTGANSYVWDFGNGSTSTGTQPSVVYSNAGTYAVSLIASTNNGCTDTFQLPAPIVVSQTPSAAFSRNPSSGCAPVTVDFTDNSSQLSGATYLWDFGNGQTSTAQNPVYTYTVPGTYTVLLQVTNAGGCVDTVSKTVIVRDVPVAAASVSDTLSCGPMTVNFTNTSTGATGYAWVFGDGTTSALTAPAHLYSNPGTYTVVLIASTAHCSDTLVLPQTITILEKPVASFTPVQPSGCTPLSVTFNSNSSQMSGATYSWLSGNGTSSSQTSLNAVYTSGGTYNVQLIVTNPNGCSDTVIHQATAYNDPVAAGFTPDTVGCHPHTAAFTNNSVNAVSYLWDFGDGTTSTQASPVHVYTSPGVYTVTLSANGNGSCGDTVVLSKTIRVFRTPVAGFTPSVNSGCTSLNVSFTNNSTQLDNPAYAWDFGNGATSSLANPSTVYTQDGLFTVELIVTNQGGCADTATSVIDSDITPQASATVAVSGNCLPVTATFVNQSQNSASYLWVFGDGNTSTQQDPVHTYSTPGTYQPYLIAWSAAGCVDTFLIPVTITASQVPVAGYTISQNAGCSGSAFTFTNTSTPSAGLSYQWIIAGASYSTASPVVTLTNPGIFGASLVVTNAAGCADTLYDPFAIQVYDTLPPLVSPIVSVSVKSDTQVEITWQNNSALDLGAYVLYRLNPVSGQFVEIYRDVNPQNSATNVTSVYTDNSLNTLANTYTYILQTLDRCNYTLPLSALTPHTTINVSASAAGQNVLVQWTPYAGCPVGSYEISRVEGVSGSATLVATVPAGTQSWVDTAFYCPGLYTYRITATSLCGTVYTSLSDTASAIPSSPLQGQTVEMVRSTVVDDRDVLTEWMPPAIAPDRVLEYLVYRSDNNSAFNLVATVPAGVHSYLDTDVEVHAQNYYYRIEVVNDCQVQTLLSNRSSSIYLQSEFNRDKTHLWWTEYIYWDTGVDYYIIEQEVQPGIWDPVKTVPGNVTDTEIDF